MAKLMLESCCFCLDLRTGCKIIAYVNTIVNAFGVFVGLSLLIGGAVIHSESDSTTEPFGLALLIAGIICMIFAGVCFTFSLVFLIGVKQHKPKHVMVYLVYSVIVFVLSFVGFIATVSTTPVAGTIIPGICGLLYAIYIILVIRSYYYKMLEETPNNPQSAQYQS